MTTLKHLAHGIVVYLASVLTTALSTKVTIDRTFLISLIPGAVAALASALSENTTLAKAASQVTALEPVAATIESHLPADLKADLARIEAKIDGFVRKPATKTAQRM